MTFTVFLLLALVFWRGRSYALAAMTVCLLGGLVSHGAVQVPQPILNVVQPTQQRVDAFNETNAKRIGCAVLLRRGDEKAMKQAQERGCLTKPYGPVSK